VTDRHRRRRREAEGGGHVPSPNSGKYCSGNYHVKFGHFVNFLANIM